MCGCPYIRPTLVVCVLFRLIDSIKAFPLIYVLTDGGPGGATQVTNYYAFEQTFSFSYWGYGSAVATLMVARRVRAVGRGQPAGRRGDR